MADRLVMLNYESLTTYRSLPPATYLFSDLELLTESQLWLADSLWQQLAQTGDRVRLLNRPRGSLKRYDLLKTLRARNLIPYDLHRSTELPEQLRFPVFVRIANDHRGSLTPLLHNRQDVSAAIVNALLRGHELCNVLVVEFCDVSDSQGIFHKYGAYRIGDRILPQQLIFSRDWIVKRDAQLVTDANIAAERDWMETNPHADQLREIFELAAIQYGRMDYSIIDGKVRCWEINSAPTLMMSPEKCRPDQLPNQQWFVRQLMAALNAIDIPTATATADQLSYKFDLRTAIREEVEA